MLSGATLIFVVQLQKNAVAFPYYRHPTAVYAVCDAKLEDSYFTVWQRSDGQKTYALASE